MRIGIGYDVHAFSKDRKLILGGVDIPYEAGLLGHSDADVLLHAITDALLGAAAAGSIGEHFPDNKPEYKGANSLELLKKVIEMLAQENYRIVNIDSVLICQRPKLASYIKKMRQNIANCATLNIGQVAVKATTTEKLGFAGREEGIAAEAVVLIEKNKE